LASPVRRVAQALDGFAGQGTVLGAAADQHRNPGYRECRNAGRHAPGLGGQALRGHPVKRPEGGNDIGAAEPIVARRHHQAEVLRRHARVEQLDREGMAFAGPADGRRQGRGLTATGNQQVGPWWGQGITVGCRRAERRQPQSRRQPRP